TEAAASGTKGAVATALVGRARLAGGGQLLASIGGADEADVAAAVHGTGRSRSRRSHADALDAERVLAAIAVQQAGIVEVARAAHVVDARAFAAAPHAEALATLADGSRRLTEGSACSAVVDDRRWPRVRRWQRRRRLVGAHEPRLARGRCPALLVEAAIRSAARRRHVAEQALAAVAVQRARAPAGGAILTGAAPVAAVERTAHRAQPGALVRGRTG